MQTLTILLKTSWQSWTNPLRHRPENRRKRVLEFIGFLVLIVALYLMGRAVLNQLPHLQAPRVLQAMNIFMLFGVLILAKDAMEGSLKHLYEAPDTALLLSMPLSPATVFGFKLIILTSSNLLNMGVWLIPPWIAFGHLFHLPWHFYLALIPTFFCLLVIIISEIVIVMLIYLRFFSSRRIIQTLKVIGTVISITIGFLLSISLIAADQSDEVAQFLLEINIPVSDWHPHLWVAKLLLSWLPESEVQAYRWGTQLIGATIGVPILAVLLASKIYHRSWEHAKGVEVNVRHKRRKPTSPIGRGRIRAMMAKDFRLFIRHRGRVTLVIMLTLIILIAMFKANAEVRRDSITVWETDSSLFVLGIQIMLYSAMITSGLTWGGFKAEAETWWLLKSGPVTPKLLFNSKFLTATLCSVIYTDFWMVAALTLFRVPIHLGLSVLFVTTLTTAVTIAFNTAVGTLPWIAEIQKANQEIRSGSDSAMSHQFSDEKRPILRMATLFVTIIANLILIIGPVLILLKINLLDEALSNLSEQFSLSVMQKIVVGTTLLFMVSVWHSSYLIGRRSLWKLLG